MPDHPEPRARLEVRLLFAPDTTLAAALAAAGLRPAGRIGVAEVWVAVDPATDEAAR